MPDEVTNGLQRNQKPHETGVRATLRKGRREGRRKEAMLVKVKHREKQESQTNPDEWGGGAGRDSRRPEGWTSKEPAVGGNLQHRVLMLAAAEQQF